MPTFMLDSNVWEKVVAPQDYSAENVYQKLHSKVVQPGTNQYYLSATVFDLEDMKRVDRLKAWQKYNVATQINTVVSGNSANLSFSIGPSHFPYLNSPILVKHANEAFNYGFKVVATSRVGMPINPLRKQHTIPLNEEQNNKIGEVSAYIESTLHAGEYSIDSLLQQYNIPWDCDFLKMIKQLPNDAVKPFSEAIAEWADGDSLATCIGMGFDYFVTNDKAGNAGTKSVFSTDNINKLKAKYPSLNVIDPKEMLAII